MITNYGDLKDAVASWLARADLTSQIPTFIQFAHARINRDVRTAAMQVTVSGLTSDTNTIPLPGDCRKVQSVRVSGYEIHPLPPESLQDASSVAPQLGYVVSGSRLQVIGGSANAAYSLTYMQEVPAMSSDADCNWLLEREPAVYLYGALIEASPYLADDERALIWLAQYKNIVDQIQAEDMGVRYGNAPAMTLRGVTP